MPSEPRILHGSLGGLERREVVTTDDVAAAGACLAGIDEALGWLQDGGVVECALPPEEALRRLAGFDAGPYPTTRYIMYGANLDGLGHGGARGYGRAHLAEHGRDGHSEECESARMGAWWKSAISLARRDGRGDGGARGCFGYGLPDRSGGGWGFGCCHGGNLGYGGQPGLKEG